MRDALVGRALDGRYQIEARLARGGMATIYLATDLRLDRTVAVKVMHPALADDAGFVSRFQREARSAARLAHNHVVAVHDQGSDDGCVYLVMEYVAGRTLRDVVREHGPLDPAQALALLDPVLEALGAAHAAGFVHRDVKPENVLISDDGRVKVADFGLARAVSSQTTGTTQGMLIGTVAYLSPEQVERGIADIRSDVYGAGILLYELLTAQVPFAGETPLAVAYQHVNTDVPPPSRVRAGLSDDLDSLVLRATRRDPDARYPDAAAFLRDVRRLRRGLPDPRPFADRRDTLVVTGVVPSVDDSWASLGALPAGTVGVPAPADSPKSPAPAPLNSPPVNSQGRPKPGGTTPPPAESPRPSARRARHTGLILVAMLALICSVAFGAWWLGAGPGRTVAVPAVVGQTEDEAGSLLDSQGLRMVVAQRVWSETIPRGQVKEVMPTPGSTLKPGDTVEAVVSSGPERYRVPALTGMTADSAKAALAKVKLKLGEQQRAYNETVKPGLILSSDPPAAKPLKRNSVVTVVVSKGPKPVPVPVVAGLSLAEAKTAVESRRLRYDVTERFSDSVPSGLVISADPRAGKVVDKGTTVSLRVSKGPPPVEVPSVVDSRSADAVDELRRLGLKTELQEGIITPLGRVYSQSPGAGEVVPRGTTVILKIF